MIHHFSSSYANQLVTQCYPSAHFPSDLAAFFRSFLKCLGETFSVWGVTLSQISPQSVSKHLWYWDWTRLHWVWTIYIVEIDFKDFWTCYSDNALYLFLRITSTLLPYSCEWILKYFIAPCPLVFAKCIYRTILYLFVLQNWTAETCITKSVYFVNCLDERKKCLLTFE